MNRTTVSTGTTPPWEGSTSPDCPTAVTTTSATLQPQDTDSSHFPSTQ